MKHERHTPVERINTALAFIHTARIRFLTWYGETRKRQLYETYQVYLENAERFKNVPFLDSFTSSFSTRAERTRQTMIGKGYTDPAKYK